MTGHEPRLSPIIHLRLLVAALLLLATPLLAGCASRSPEPTPSTTGTFWAYRYYLSDNRTIGAINAYADHAQCEASRTYIAAKRTNVDVSSCRKVVASSSPGGPDWMIRVGADMLGVTNEAACHALRDVIVTQRKIQAGTCEAMRFIDAD